MNDKKSVLASIDGVAILSLAIIELSVLIWTAYDHSIPCWDTAAHRLNSLTVYKLMRHPHLFSLHWYRDIFAVSPLYPPLFYIFSACLKFIVGRQAETELIGNSILIVLLFFSLYYCGRSIDQKRATGICAAVLVFLYPLIYWSCHTTLLDFAANAAVGIGLLCFIWWSKDPKSSKSIILGILLGLGALTKNNVPIFFVGPVLTEIFFAWRDQIHQRKDYSRIKQLCLVFISAALVILPWAALAGPSVIKFVASIQQQDFGVHNRLAEMFLQMKRFTFEDLSVILSPLLCICWLLSLAAIVKYRHLSKANILLIASIFGSIIVASFFRWPHQCRYIVPVAIPAALITAQMVTAAWLTHKIWLRTLLVAVTGLALMQFIYISFMPYPVQRPQWISGLMKIMWKSYPFVQENESIPGVSMHPLCYTDWGLEWSLATIKVEDKDKNSSLMIMPGSIAVNCSSFSYLSKVKNYNIEVGTAREHTELGDRVRFDPQLAKWYEWYILKTGSQGEAFCDTKSKQAYDQWCNFVSDKKLYQLESTKALPDGTTMELFRRII